jgi:hypothetical protein
MSSDLVAKIGSQAGENSAGLGQGQVTSTLPEASKEPLQSPVPTTEAPKDTAIEVEGNSEPRKRYKIPPTISCCDPQPTVLTLGILCLVISFAHEVVKYSTRYSYCCFLTSDNGFKLSRSSISFRSASGSWLHI